MIFSIPRAKVLHKGDPGAEDTEERAVSGLHQGPFGSSFGSFRWLLTLPMQEPFVMDTRTAEPFVTNGQPLKCSNLNSDVTNVKRHN